MLQGEDENHWQNMLPNLTIKALEDAENQEVSTSPNESENENSQISKFQENHDAANILVLNCKCSNCIKSKRIITMLVADEILYAEQWKKFQDIILNFYSKLIPRCVCLDYFLHDLITDYLLCVSVVPRYVKSTNAM